MTGCTREAMRTISLQRQHNFIKHKNLTHILSYAVQSADMYSYTVNLKPNSHTDTRTHTHTHTHTLTATHIIVT